MVHSPIRRPARMALVALLAAAVTALPAPSSATAGQPGWRNLAAAPAPDANPLEGFIPYAGAYTTFPHSMEWFYLPVNAVMTGPHRFDWRALEEQLDAIAARGHQAAFRFYLDYPGKPSGVPQFLLDQGLLTRPYDDFGNNGQSVSPDYDDPNLTAALDRFIAALGRRYDGDPRIGFVQLGLLGFWGEWHTWPHNGDPGTENWFASPAEQLRVLDAYDRAFDRTRLMVPLPRRRQQGARPGLPRRLLRLLHPAGPRLALHGPDAAGGHHRQVADQHGRRRAAARAAGLPVQRADGTVPATGTRTSDTSVAQTHATWLLNHYAFSPGYTGAAYDQALKGARSLGYELRVTAVRTERRRGSLGVAVRISNDGVAPFSYDWPVQLAAVGRDGRIARTWTTSWKLTGVMPGEPAELTATCRSGCGKGEYTLVLRAANPLPNGMPLRFANAGQDTTVPGWLTLGRIRAS
ncbi:hypothetical protein GCM10020220_103580 [Nonomuraea rubra]|uniref:hypothetical protein n=1 Tax=Nonomuraea rubra TaxID=46180 RepID=UPI0031E9DDC5